MNTSSERQTDPDCNRRSGVNESAVQDPNGHTETQRLKRIDNDGQRRRFLIYTCILNLLKRHELNILVLSFIYVLSIGIHCIYLFYFLNT